MPPTLRPSCVLAALFALLFMLGCNRGGGPPGADAPDAQVPTEAADVLALTHDGNAGLERTMRAATFDSTTLAQAGRQGLEAPAMLRTGPGGDLFVADMTGLRVFRYSPGGTLHQIYGRGRGAGPGEFGDISDVSAAPDGGRVYVADQRQHRITVFTADGTVAQVIQTPASPNRIAALPGQRVAALHIGRAHANEPAVSVYDREGAEVERFGRFVSNDLETDASQQQIVNGWLLHGASGDLIWSGFHAGRLARFSPEGALRWYANMLDGTDILTVSEITAGAGHVRLLLGTTATNVAVFPLETDVSASKYLDFYNKASGAYRFSVAVPFVRPPNRCGPQALAERTVYTVCDQTRVVGWTMRFADAGTTPASTR